MAFDLFAHPQARYFARPQIIFVARKSMNNSSRSGTHAAVTAWICLGSNIGDRKLLLQQASEHIAQRTGKIISCSSFYESAGWGTDSPNRFLNQVLAVETALGPGELLAAFLSIEQLLGRHRTGVRNSDRLIDIDLLFYGDQSITEEGLEVPHPRLHLRRFVLVPLSEIAPALVHPVLKKTVRQLLQGCPDRLDVVPDVSG